MNELEMREIGERDAKATPGPWQTDGMQVYDEATLGTVADVVFGPSWMEPNGQFIAHARQDIPTLVAELREARRLLCDWCAAFEHPDEPEGLYRATRAVLGEEADDADA